MSVQNEAVYRFQFDTKYCTLESLFVAEINDIEELDNYHNYSIVEMFGYDAVGRNYKLDYLLDSFWDNNIKSYITKCSSDKKDIEFVKKYGVGPDIVEFIHDYGEIYVDYEDENEDENEDEDEEH